MTALSAATVLRKPIFVRAVTVPLSRWKAQTPPLHSFKKAQAQPFVFLRFWGGRVSARPFFKPLFILKKKRDIGIIKCILLPVNDCDPEKRCCFCI